MDVTAELLVQFVSVFMVLVVFQGMIVVFLVWLLRKRQVWGLINFALKGGSLVLKGHPDNTIEITQFSKPVEVVKWKSKDELGRSTELVQSISRVYHTLKGTSYPIHICPCSYPTSINILTKEKAQLSNKEINALMAKQYNQGAADATSFKNIAGFPIDKATLVMLLVVGVLIVVVVAMNWQILSYVGGS